MTVRLAQPPMNTDIPLTSGAGYPVQDVAVEFPAGHYCNRYRTSSHWYECGHGHVRRVRQHIHLTTVAVGGERR